MRNYLLLIATLLATTADAQMVDITGKVTETGGVLVSSATVLLHRPDSSVAKGTLTDSLGEYYFSQVVPDTYFISVFMIGYSDHKSKLFRPDISSYNLPDIILKEGINTLKEVSISTGKKLFEMHAEKLVMNVENSILASGNSVFEVLRKAPSVTTDKDDNVLLKGTGCRILIDGKPSYLRGSQLTDYLKSLPADAVSKIEFITNPSSKYDAEGSGGIINIRLKKNTNTGLNGTANCGLGYGRYPKENAGINLNYRHNKINIFGNGFAGHSESYNLLTYNTVVSNNGIKSSQNRSQYWHPFALWSSGMGGIDYNIGKNTSIGFLVNGSTDNTKAQTNNNTVVSDALHHPYQYIHVLKNDTSNNANTTWNINFKTRIDTSGSELTFDMDYATYQSHSISHNENKFTNAIYAPTRDPYIFLNNQSAHIRIKSAKTDFTCAITNSMKLEAGMKYSSVNIANNLAADSMQGASWVKDNNRSNRFMYEETILAGYATINRDWEHTSAQAGVRAEQTNSTGTSPTLNTVQKRNYLNLFPSLFVTQTISKNHQLNFSYTRRIQRPQYQALNPFTFYIDPYTLFAGNPYLKPTYTNSLEVKHGYKQVLFIFLGFNHSTSELVEAVFQDKATGITTNISKNANSSDYVMLGSTATIKLSKIWSANINTSIGTGRNYSSIPGFSFNATARAADISTDHTWMLPRNYKMQTHVYYSIPTRSGITYLRSDYGWDMGIQKQIWNRNATIKLNATTIIGPSAYRAHIISDNLDIKWENKWEGRKVNLSFAWKFGNKNVKANRTHNTSSEEEKSRIK